MEERQAVAVVNTLSEIVEHIRVWNHQNDELWFRGQSESHWPLQPGAYRLPFRQQSESSFVEHFRRLAASDAMRFGLDEWGWIAFAQHHGVPTRLLDWSTSPMPALYFAVSGDIPDKVTHSAFFMIKPWDMNKQYFNNAERHGPILLSDSKGDLESFRPDNARGRQSPDKPVAVIAPTTFDRLRFQSGTFTMYIEPHGGIYDEYDPISSESYCHKVLIPRESREQILEDLAILGVDEYAIYRDNDRLAAQVKRSVARSQ